MKFLVTLSAVLTLSVLSAALPDWTSYGPSKAVTARKVSGDITQITFNPKLVAPGKYWCGARISPVPATQNRVMTFDIKANTATKVQCKVTSSNGKVLYRNVEVSNDWENIKLDFTQPLPDIAAFEFIFMGTWQPVSLQVRNVKFSPKVIAPEYARCWMPKTVPAPVPGYRVETTIHACWRNKRNTFKGIGTPQGRAMALDIVKKLKKEYGDISVAFVFHKNMPQKELKSFVGELNKMNVVVLSEGHDNPSQDEVKKYDLYARNNRGETYVLRGHNADKTNPKVQELLYERLKVSADAGANVYRSVDYVWQWHGGPVWGHTDAAKRRWVENLTGKDVKIEILNADGSRKKVGFHDYFKSYFGYMMKPEDCGISSWEEYLPPAYKEPASPAKHNKQTVFNALYHYEWVKFLNESVRPYEAQGMRAQPTLNPENMYNGTDLYWMLKSSLTRGWCTEWWGGATVIIPVYYHSKYYGNIASKFGKEVIHLGETGAAGNSFGCRPNYWDNMANYLITYVKSAACDAKVMNDQYWAASYEEMTNPEDKELYDMYTGYRSAWSGFLQSKHDKAVKPAASMLVFQNRSVMHNIANFDTGGGNAPLSIAQNMMIGNYVYDGASFPFEDAYDLEDYNTIVHTALYPPAGFGKKLAAWLNNAPGRTLITHSDILNREFAPVKDLAEVKAEFRSGRTFQVLPEIQKGNVSSGTLRTNIPELAAALGKWNGEKVSFPVPLAKVSGGKTLVSLDNAPLISEFKVGKSRIIYLHNQPLSIGQNAKKLQTALVKAAMTAAGKTPVALSPDTHRVMVFDRRGNDGKIVFIINVSANTTMERNGKNYRCYQAINPNAKGKFTLNNLQPSVKYSCRNMIDGKVFTATSTPQGTLTIPYTGWDLAGFYIDKIK